MSKTAPRLGKGLSAIIGPRDNARKPKPQVHSPEARESRDGSHEIPLGRIHPNRRQPRSEFEPAALEQLAESIRTHGVMQPAVVRAESDGSYELIAGERRWRAAKLAGLDALPVIIRQCTDAEAYELALIENLQREDLNPLERAKAYQAYISDLGVSADELARRISQSRANVANYMRLLNLSDVIQQMVSSGELGMGQARAIAGVSDPERQLGLARMSVRRNLSVRQVEALAKAEPRESRAPEPQTAADRHLQEVEQALGRSLGVSVSLATGRRKNSGRIIIHYKNLEEFDRIAELLNGSANLDR